MTTTTISLINELIQVDKISISLIDAKLGCKLVLERSPEYSIELFAPDPSITSNEYSTGKSAIYPQIKKLKYKEFQSKKLTENTLSIILKANEKLHIDTVISELGDDYSFVTQPENVPEDKRCYIEYKISNKVLILGFENCKNLKEFNSVIIRYN